MTNLELGRGCELKKELTEREKALEESQGVLNSAQKDLNSSRRVRDAAVMEYKNLVLQNQSLTNEIYKVKSQGGHGSRQQQLDAITEQVSIF